MACSPSITPKKILSFDLSLMSFMNLGKRLQPAKKAWKTFTTKLHTKLHKLRASKSIKKPKNRLKATPRLPPPLTFKSSKNRTIQKTHMILHSFRLKKRSAAPVYIDELFNEPSTRKKMIIKDKVNKCSSSSGTVVRLCDLNAGNDFGLGKTERVEREEIIYRSAAADEMWESLQLASPLMHGINERAEEFIARIKAEMHCQETMARRL